MDKHDQILRAIARISSIKDAAPSNTFLERRWVDEYHAALTSIETTLNTTLEEFKVESNSICRIPVSGNYITGETIYSDEVFCERSILLQKTEAVLKYLNFLLQPAPPPEKKIGF
jgi:hypothetical protein